MKEGLDVSAEAGELGDGSWMKVGSELTTEKRRG